MKLSHLDDKGAARMVDISAKPVVKRTAAARSTISMQPGTIRMIREGLVKKGDVLATARIAGICAAKKTSDLIPLCHNIEIDHVSINFTIKGDSIAITSAATCTDRTGIEMEALTAAAVAALTIYDMCKAVDKSMVIGDIALVEKTKEETERSR